MPASASQNLSRRSFLGGRPHAQPVPLRPPWTDDARVSERCTGCNACVAACPESVLRLESDRPVVVLDGGECSFCGACAEACEAGVFDASRTPAWPVTAEISAGCLLQQDVACQLCTDVCPQDALRIDLSWRPVGRIEPDVSACSGCGACLGTCPVDAIALVDGRLAV